MGVFHYPTDPELKPGPKLNPKPDPKPYLKPLSNSPTEQKAPPKPFP